MLARSQLISNFGPSANPVNWASYAPHSLKIKFDLVVRQGWIRLLDVLIYGERRVIYTGPVRVEREVMFLFSVKENGRYEHLGSYKGPKDLADALGGDVAGSAWNAFAVERDGVPLGQTLYEVRLELLKTKYTGKKVCY